MDAAPAARGAAGAGARPASASASGSAAPRPPARRTLGGTLVELPAPAPPPRAARRRLGAEPSPRAGRRLRGLSGPARALALGRTPDASGAPPGSPAPASTSHASSTAPPPRHPTSPHRRSRTRSRRGGAGAAPAAAAASTSVAGAATASSTDAVEASTSTAPASSAGAEGGGGSGSLARVLRRARAADAAAACLLHLMATLPRLRLLTEHLDGPGGARGGAAGPDAADRSRQLLSQIMELGGEMEELVLLQGGFREDGAGGGGLDLGGQVDEGIAPFIGMVESIMRQLHIIALEVLGNLEQQPKGLTEPEFKRLLTTNLAGVTSKAFAMKQAPPTECAICLGAFTHSEKLTQLPCSWMHVFHRDCVHSWLQQCDNCPLCRKSCHLAAPDPAAADGAGGAASQPLPLLLPTLHRQRIRPSPSTAVRGRREAGGGSHIRVIESLRSRATPTHGSIRQLVERQQAEEPRAAGDRSAAGRRDRFNSFTAAFSDERQEREREGEAVLAGLATLAPLR